MKLLVTGGAGFIGSTYVRRHLAENPGDEIVVLDKLTYAGRRENLAGRRSRAAHVRRGRHRRPRAPSPAAIAGCDAIVNFAAESHVDRSIDDPGAFIQTDVFGTYVLLEAARDAGIRHLQISTDEVYGSIEAGHLHRDLAAGPLLALLGLEGRRRSDRQRLPPHLRRRRADHPRLEQLRALPAPREADPADGPQRARRRSDPRLRRRHAGPQLALRRGLRRRDRRRARSAARPGRSTTSAAPRRSRTSRWSSGSSSSAAATSS